MDLDPLVALATLCKVFAVFEWRLPRRFEDDLWNTHAARPPAPSATVRLGEPSSARASGARPEPAESRDSEGAMPRLRRGGNRDPNKELRFPPPRPATKIPTHRTLTFPPKQASNSRARRQNPVFLRKGRYS